VGERGGRRKRRRRYGKVGPATLFNKGYRSSVGYVVYFTFYS